MAIRNTVAYATKTAAISTAAVTIGAVAFGWAATDLDRAARAWVSAQDADIRVTWSGVTPTGVIGHEIADTYTLILNANENIQNLKFILDSDAAGDAVVVVTLEK